MGALGGALFAFSACVPQISCEDTATCPPDDDSGAPEAAGSDVRSDSAARATPDASTDGYAPNVDGAVLDAQATDAAADGNDVLPPGDAQQELLPSCDATKLPSEDACVIDAKYAVFVSPTGNDVNAGTATAPLKTLNRAITVASSRGARVYACASAGPYFESVTISTGVAIFGGFNCATSIWTYSLTHLSTVKSAVGVPLTISVTGAVVRLTDMEFDAPFTGLKGESSVAALVTSSSNVLLTRVKLVAEDAQAGADAPAASNYDTALTPEDPKITGHNAVGALGGETQSCALLCADNVHATGGKGGDGSAAPAGAGAAGTPTITPPSRAGQDGLGGAGRAPDGFPCANGNWGSDAPPGAGGAGASVAGTLTATGWIVGADGAPGTPGSPGQGGGGGGGGTSATQGGGGGGACGGCGGAAGAGGKTGGSSFALLSYQSSVQLFGCSLFAGKGGAGGKGGDGQVGQTGGYGGGGASSACNGGSGGQGGAGGGGGGGAGGLSVAIGYSGTSPGRDAATVTQVATGGAPGTGGAPAATMGKKGFAVAVQDLTR